MSEENSKMREPIGGPSWPEERARYGEYASGATEPIAARNIDREALEAALGQYIKNWAAGGPLSRALVSNQADAVMDLLTSGRGAHTDLGAAVERQERTPERNSDVPK